MKEDPTHFKEMVETVALAVIATGGIIMVILAAIHILGRF